MSDFAAQWEQAQQAAAKQIKAAQRRTKRTPIPQIARLLKNAQSGGWNEPLPEGHCPLCHEWMCCAVSHRAAEEFLGYEVEWGDPADENYDPTMLVMRLLSFDTEIGPDERLAVVPLQATRRDPLGGGTYVTRKPTPVHLMCFYIAMLNGRRQRGLIECTCRHCDRKFHARTALDWCHTCTIPERTCEHCTGPLRESFAGIFTGEERQQPSRADARYCSDACRVAAHRARKTG